MVEVEEQPLPSGFNGAGFLDAKDAQNFSQIAVGDAPQPCG